MNSFDLEQDYQHAQHSLIAHLTQQIQALLPIQYSYSDLKTYRDKIQQSLEIIAQQNYTSTQMQLEQIKQLMTIYEQLDERKSQLIDKTQELQRHKSKLNLQRKNYLNLCEAQNNRYALETKQNKIIKQRTTQLIANAEALKNSIHRLKQNLSILKQNLTIKQEEIKQTENDIQYQKQKNFQLLQKKQELQKKLKQTTNKSQQTVQENRNIIMKRQNVEKEIENTLNNNKLLKQRIIQMKKSIQDQKNQQQYHQDRIQRESNIIKSLQEKQQVLNQSLDIRKKQLIENISQNNEIQLQIQSQKQLLKKQFLKQQLSKTLLNQLIEANRNMLAALENSCKQDRLIYECLNRKYDRLDILRQNVEKSEQRQLQGISTTHNKTISIVDKFYLKQNESDIISSEKGKNQNYPRIPLQDYNYE